MSDTECWLCESPEVAYVDALTLPWCLPCWNGPGDPDFIENLKGIRYELWQERGQRLIGAKPCSQQFRQSPVASHDSDLPIELWGPFECHACKACV